MSVSAIRIARPYQLVRSFLFKDPLKSVTRPASSHATDKNFGYGPEYESREGFRHPFFLWTGISLVGLVLYHNYVPQDDGQQPWLTRYIKETCFSNLEAIKETEAHNIAVVLESVELGLFKSSIERPVIRRLKNFGNFNISSPYGVVPGSQIDFSDLKIKSFHDDLEKPEQPQHTNNEN